MRASYRFTDRKIFAGLEQESYQVLAYGAFDEISKFFLIANDNLHIMNFDQTALEIIDEDLSEYIQKNELNYNKEFYIHRDLLESVSDFENYHQILVDNIWERSKISNFFIKNNYLIPNSYKNTVLNLEYKQNLIEGYLIFANHYINIKNQIGDYWDELFFYVTESFETIVDDSDKKVEKLDLLDYKMYLQNFIRANLYDEEQNEVKSIDMSKSLFKIIDSIFLNQIESIYIIETFYDNVFAIKYENKYYCLNKSWGS